MTSAPTAATPHVSSTLRSCLARLDRRRSAATMAAVVVAVLLQILPEAIRPEIHGVVNIAEATAESGHLRTIPLTNELPWFARPFWRLPDQRLDGSAALNIVADDGVRLGPRDSVHAEIAELGGGRYSVWSGWLYFSLPDPTIEQLRWSGRAPPRPWCRTIAALLLTLASLGTIFQCAHANGRGVLASPVLSIAMAMIALLPWSLAVQPLCNSTDSACLLMWPREFIGHWTAVPCGWSALLQWILPIEWVGVAWIASGGMLFAVSLGLLASLARTITGRLAIIVAIALVPLLPSVALGVLVDSATPSGGLLAAASIILIDRIGRSRASLAMLAAAMLVLVSSRPLAFVVLIAVPLLPLLWRQSFRPGWRDRLVEASKVAAASVLFLITAISIQDATAHAVGASARSRPGRAASECLARMFWLDPSLSDWVRGERGDLITSAESFVLDRASLLASGTNLASAVVRDSEMPRGVWPQVLGIGAGDATIEQLERAAMSLYLRLVVHRPDSMLRAQGHFLPEYLWPSESAQLEYLRHSVDQIIDEPLYARVHPAFASISNPTFRSAPSLVPAGAIAPFLALLLLIGVAGPRVIRSLVPVGPPLAALLGGCAYIVSTVAAILFYKPTYLVAATAVWTGVAAVISACAIEDALRRHRNRDAPRITHKQVRPSASGRGVPGRLHDARASRVLSMRRPLGARTNP